MNLSTMANASHEAAQMDILPKGIGYLLEPLLFAVPYPYIAFYPVYTAARHVRSLGSFTTSNSEMSGVMANKPNNSLISVVYPTKGVLLWLLWHFPQHLAQLYLATAFPRSVAKSIPVTLFAPLHLLWVQAILSDSPSSTKTSLRHIRSVTMMQWLRFIATILMFHLIEHGVEIIFELSFKTFMSHQSLGGQLETGEARWMGAILMVHYFASEAFKLLLRVPATVAAVQAAPAVDTHNRDRSTSDFYTDMVDSMKSIPLTLWWRFGIYYGVAAALGISSRLIDTTLTIKFTHGNLTESL